MPGTRILLALGPDPRRGPLQEALELAGVHVLVANAAEEAGSHLQGGGVGAVLVVATLTGLSRQAWQALLKAETPVLLLGDAGDATTYPGHATLLPPDAGVAGLATALLALLAPGSGRAPANPSSAPAGPPPPPESYLLVVTGAADRAAYVAANLALLLGITAATVLVDAATEASLLTPLLDADDLRGLGNVAQAAPGRPAVWDRVLERESQRLHPGAPHARLLGGLPRPELAAGIDEPFATALCAELRARYRFSLLLTDAAVLGPSQALGRAALRAADEVLLVIADTGASLALARGTLDRWDRQLHLPRERVRLAVQGVGCRPPRDPHGFAEALDLPLVAALPEDRAAVAQTSIGGPLAVTGRGGPYAAALRALAEGLVGGRLPTLHHLAAPALPRSGAPLLAGWHAARGGRHA